MGNRTGPITARSRDKVSEWLAVRQGRCRLDAAFFRLTRSQRRRRNGRRQHRRRWLRVKGVVVVRSGVAQMLLLKCGPTVCYGDNVTESAPVSGPRRAADARPLALLDKSVPDRARWGAVLALATRRTRTVGQHLAGELEIRDFADQKLPARFLLLPGTSARPEASHRLSRKRLRLPPSPFRLPPLTAPRLSPRM